MPVRAPITLHDATANSFKPSAPVDEYAVIFGPPWKFCHAAASEPIRSGDRQSGDERPDTGCVMRVVIILVSAPQQQAGNLASGTRLGTFLDAYYRLRDAGAEVVLASANGGYPWPDLAREDEDASTPATQRFRQDRAARDELNDTLRLDQICVADFDAGFCIGGADHVPSPEAGLVGRLLALGKPVAIIEAIAKMGANGVQDRHLITARTVEAALAGVQALLGSSRP
jgi:hypothetical protein